MSEEADDAAHPDEVDEPRTRATPDPSAAVSEPIGAPRAAGEEAELGDRRLGLVATVGLTVLALDQLTKEWALRALTGEPPIDVIGSLRFNLHFNTGAAFSLGSGRGIGPWVAIVALVVIVALAAGTTSRIRWGAVATGLIAGGAIGNLLDRAFRGDDGFMHGGVVDFIDLQWWPVFNIADAAVVVGAILLVLVSLRMSAP